MIETLQAVPFLEFLRAGIRRGFATDDGLTAVIPLFSQVAQAHEAGKVGPLRGPEALQAGQGRLWFEESQLRGPHKAPKRLQKLQHALDTGAELGSRDDKLTRPVYLPNYICWEHLAGHHDELTDIFSLGMVLASLACNLDFSDPEDLAAFVTHRANLFTINKRLNPVVAAAIVKMTELNRHRRAQDLETLTARLRNYRSQAIEPEFDFSQLKGFHEAALNDKRTTIQHTLRERLFEISRRNRLLYFRQTLGSVNLTIASVPVLLDYSKIHSEQLFIWHEALAKLLAAGSPLALNKYLRFEDAAYLPGALDRIRLEARRDKNEFGFSQLRLVLCFFRWHNLKEEPAERIHSPLLLFPVELTKQKGVRDSFTLTPISSLAEVNPALRHYLKQLYDIDLPEAIDLNETKLDTLYEVLRRQIHASDPGIVLNKLEHPRLESIHALARQRLEQYRRRVQLSGQGTGVHGNQDYSSKRQNFPPLGSQLSEGRIQGSEAGPGKAEGQKELEPNPYSWDFDLCNITLGNFNYRKMSLVRDYTTLIESDLSSQAFDDVFALAPSSGGPPAGVAAVPQSATLQCADGNYLVLPADPTQVSALTKARRGESYIIQGPPGTGKSQTITNLIADYAAAGKRVLFVCAKRAALDVVYYRLKQRGLDKFCCLIHDSQTDKKKFIQDLKKTYEDFRAGGSHSVRPRNGKIHGSVALQSETKTGEKREQIIRRINADLEALERFSAAMCRVDSATGVPLRQLLERLIELRPNEPKLNALEKERLPLYPAWIESGAVVRRLAGTLRELGCDPRFGKHPLRLLSLEIVKEDHPLETIHRRLAGADDLLDELAARIAGSGLAEGDNYSCAEMAVVARFAEEARPLADRNLLVLLDGASDCARSFAALVRELKKKERTADEARKVTANWQDKLSPGDTREALELARKLEGAILPRLHVSWWRLCRALNRRYDFGRHAVRPKWSTILQELAAEHEACEELEKASTRLREDFGVGDPDVFQQGIERLRAAARNLGEGLREQLINSGNGPAIVQALAGAAPVLEHLEKNLRGALADLSEHTLKEIRDNLTELKLGLDQLPELLPNLRELAELPAGFNRALRALPFTDDEFEAAVARKSLEQVYLADHALSAFDVHILERRLESLQKNYRNLFRVNAEAITQRIRREFLTHLHLSRRPDAQLIAKEKAFKKLFAAGCRELQREFNKSRVHKSIRDLASGASGVVLRDLKPVWLMSPLSVSDTIPLDSGEFDVVIFDEASQIPLEEAVPAIYRSGQVIVVGDRMQLPPTNFFSSKREAENPLLEEDGQIIEYDLSSDSFLTHATRSLPSTLLGWHYRSRHEALISFSNALFYQGKLLTVPDCQVFRQDDEPIVAERPDQGLANVPKVLGRSLSFHFLENTVYERRRNPAEAAYIAHLVRGLLLRETQRSLGIVAFSEMQQAEIEGVLAQLARQDQRFGNLLEAEEERVRDDQFCGLFVKNLENVQGDERDIIIISVCYGPDRHGRVRMHFGPINQGGGERRLNVIFSRAKYHMAVVSSIRHDAITNDYNDGANCLKNFLHYAEAVSSGAQETAGHVLASLMPDAPSRPAGAVAAAENPVARGLQQALAARGFAVDRNVGQSAFRCDLAVRRAEDRNYRLGILIDSAEHYQNPDILERYLLKPNVLTAFGWRLAIVLGKDWDRDPDTVLSRLERRLNQPDDDI